MKNAYQRRRVKARVEKRARMMKLDRSRSNSPGRSSRKRLERRSRSSLASVPRSLGETATKPKLVARDEKKTPLISTFDWTEDATKRILRVPAGFMRNKTQERIEELARERDVKGIDLALVEEGIELGKKMMAETIATSPLPHRRARSATSTR